MPWNVSRSGQFLEKEILRFPVGLDAVKSIVLDANTFAMPAGGAQNVVPAGTILKLSLTDATRYVKYDGAAGSGIIKGILAHSVEILASATPGNEPAPMYFHGCVFATPAIVDFTLYASSLGSSTALSTSKFE
jgi:hypothetical protein